MQFASTRLIAADIEAMVGFYEMVTPIRQGSCRLINSEDNDAPIFRGT